MRKISILLLDIILLLMIVISEAAAQTESSSTLTPTNHVKTWSLDFGRSIFMTKDADPRLSIGLIRQYGFQLSPDFHFSIGGEIRSYNGQDNHVDAITGKKTSILYNVWSLGVPVSFHTEKIDKRFSWYFDLSVAPGAGYIGRAPREAIVNPIVNEIRFTIHGLVSGGGAFKLGSNHFEIGPYVDCLDYSSKSLILAYGLRISTFR